MTAAPDRATASRWARTALANVRTEFPTKQDHVIDGPRDAATSRALHPAFWGSFDWHSCVHMHWSLARLLRLVPDLPERDAIVAVLDEDLAPDAIAGECAYLARPSARGFSRPYGWAWLLELAREVARADGPRAARWSSALAPLASAFEDRWLDWLPRAGYAVRHGMHPNSAFGLALSLDYARAAKRDELARAIEGAARDWFGADVDAPASWEPSGRRLPLARARRGEPDAARAAARGLRRLARALPARPRRTPPGDALRARVGERPHRRPGRAPRRPQPVARLVLRGDRRRTARGTTRASRPCARPPRRTAPPGSPASPATTSWASTGSCRSRCSRRPASAACRRRHAFAGSRVCATRPR